MGNMVVAYNTLASPSSVTRTHAPRERTSGQGNIRNPHAKTKHAQARYRHSNVQDSSARAGTQQAYGDEHDHLAGPQLWPVSVTYTHRPVRLEWMRRD